MDVRRLACALADAMLAGPASPVEVRARCATALGRNPRWLASLVRRVITEHGAQWSPSARDALAESILAHGSLLRQLHDGKALTIRRYFISPATMGRPPLALAGCVLPALASVTDLARWLELSVEELEWLARSRAVVHSDHYRYRWLAKRRGGWRLLEQPKTSLRAVQRQLLHGLLEYLPPHEAAHGFRVGHSIVTHAQLHVAQRVVLKMDLQDFFLTIRGARVNALFLTLGYPAAVACLLTALCTNRVPAQTLQQSHAATCSSAASSLDWELAKRYSARHLPQGAPSSPALANLGAFGLDLRLQAAAERFGARYSRYADDLTFSGGPEFLRRIDNLIPLVGAVATDEGMRVNFRKTRVMKSARRQEVTGVVVNRHANLRRDSYDRLKATLHNCVRHGPQAENRDARPDFRAHLHGAVAHAMMLNPSRGQKLRNLLQLIDWAK